MPFVSDDGLFWVVFSCQRCSSYTPGIFGEVSFGTLHAPLRTACAYPQPTLLFSVPPFLLLQLCFLVPLLVGPSPMPKSAHQSRHGSDQVELP
jgi:hypothetical protein